MDAVYLSCDGSLFMGLVVLMWIDNLAVCRLEKSGMGVYLGDWSEEEKGEMSAGWLVAGGVWGREEERERKPEGGKDRK